MSRTGAHATAGAAFDNTVWSYPGALFLSAGGYHHHLGTNSGRLARFGEPEAPKLSQETLADEMVGTTPSHVDFFMNKFRKLGFIDYNGALTINNSILRVVLRD